MVRATKTSTSTSQSAPVSSTPDVSVQKSAAPVSAPKPRSKKPKSDTVSPVEAVVEKPLVDLSVSAPVAETVLTNELSTSLSTSVVTDTTSSVLLKMTDFSAKLQLLVGIFSTLKNDYKSLEKLVTREMKNAKKASSKKRRINANRKPSGFIKPTRISDELAEFLGKTIGTEMARTEVSKEINTYIHTNGLQDKSNGRKINPDTKLTKLLKLNKEDELTYFNLQRYMKHHFIKPEVAVEVTQV
jgi:chromatin remodeling complex protein RSC6